MGSKLGLRDPGTPGECVQGYQGLRLGRKGRAGLDLGRHLGHRTGKSKPPTPITTAQESPEALLHQLLPLHGDAAAGPAQATDVHAPGAVPGAAAGCPGGLGLPH